MAQQQSTSPALDILQQLEQKTKVVKQDARVFQRLDEVRRELTLAEEQAITETSVTEKKRKQQRAKVLGANYADLRQDVESGGKDLVEDVASLVMAVEALGTDYQIAQQPSQEDLQRIYELEATLKDAEMDLTAASQKWKILGRARAEEKARVKIAQVTSDIKEAKKQAHINARKRFHNARWDVTAQTLQVRAEQVLSTVGKRVEILNTQIVAIKERREAAQEIRSGASSQLAETENTLEDITTEWQTEEGLLAEMEMGTPEYANQDAKVRGLQTRKRELEGTRTNLIEIIQTKENAIRRETESEVSALTNREILSIQATGLRSKLQETIPMFQVAIAISGALSDSDAMKGIGDGVDKIDDFVHDIVVKSKVAADRSLTERLKTYPEILRRIKEISALGDEGVAVQQAEQEVAINKFAEVLGLSHEELSALGARAPNPS